MTPIPTPREASDPGCIELMQKLNTMNRKDGVGGGECGMMQGLLPRSETDWCKKYTGVWWNHWYPVGSG